MFMQRTRHTNRLAVVRTHHARRQISAGTTDVFENMVHLAIRFGRFPGFALHGDGTHRIGRTQLIPRHQTRGGVTPFLRTCEIKHGTMPMLDHQMHHVGHGRPLVHSHYGYSATVGRFHQAQTILHADAAVRGGDDDARLRDLRTAGGGKHNIRRREENERVHVHLIER